MKILILGGTRFVGPHVVRELVAAGHDVVLFHRGKTNPDLPSDVEHVHGDFANFDQHIDKLRALRPEVVLDMVPFREEDAQRVLAFAGVARRILILSSCDVYRAFGRLVRTEPGDPDPVPLVEESPLRERLSIGGEGYNKTAVERLAASDPKLPCTILRLPAIHGPGDYQHRLYSYVKRMADGRPAILLDEWQANWHWMRGYVQDVAHAVALAVVNDRAAGRVYNVADARNYTELQWVQRMAQATGYGGRIVSVPHDLMPRPMRCEEDMRQQMVVDSSRIRSELGFAEIVAEGEALRSTADWELANPPPAIRAEDFDYAAEDEVLQRLPLDQFPH